MGIGALSTVVATRTVRRGRSLTIVRDGARAMLAAALQAEVAAYIVNARHLVDLVRAGARFKKGNSSNDPTNQKVISKSRDSRFTSLVNPPSNVEGNDSGMTDEALKYDFDRPELIPFVPQTARTLLEVGCGSGAFGRRLRSERPNMELWAIEPDPASAKAAEDGFHRVIVDEFPSEGIPRGAFQVVVCADVLEHMAEPQLGLRGAAEVLAPGGVMVASIPNVRSWRAVIWPLLAHGNWTYTERGILDRTHLRFFTRRSMRQFFNDNGWSVHSVTGINMHRRERVLSVLGARRFDDFLFPQYVVVATPPRMSR
jgi:2-polyprenyl-3-methyl-5-hydroxy-6-metoxy-1,4-benzoquinol methylase